jgi:hypothetical protein
MPLHRVLVTLEKPVFRRTASSRSAQPAHQLDADELVAAGGLGLEDLRLHRQQGQRHQRQQTDDDDRLEQREAALAAIAQMAASPLP